MTKTTKWSVEMYSEVQDSVTLLKGKVISRREDVNLTRNYLIQPEIKNDGSWADAYWIEEERVSPTNGKNGLGFQGDSQK